MQVIAPGSRCGQLRVPASKSEAHRALILAALGREESSILCDGISRDIEATMACLRALGAAITVTGGREIRITPISAPPKGVCHLPCGESGSTLRFLLPVAGALGAQAVFHLSGRLPRRPLAPLDDALCAHGMRISLQEDALHCSGQLLPGAYTLPGNVSSQYISGLLLALPLLAEDSTLAITGAIESADYIRMTEDLLLRSGISWQQAPALYRIPGRQRPRLPSPFSVEGDYSSAAFFLCMGALSPQGIAVAGLNPLSLQGDRRVLDILSGFGAQVITDSGRIAVRQGTLSGCVADASQIPDLIPALSAVAALARGETRFVNAGRLRLKESDRLRATTNMLTALGADIREDGDSLILRGRPALTGGEAKTFGDHRIAMAAAVAACACRSKVILHGSECVEKSYPRFWQDFFQLERSKT